MPNIGVTLTASFNSAFYAVVNFIPKFLAGAIILLVGIIIASILKTTNCYSVQSAKG